MNENEKLGGKCTWTLRAVGVVLIVALALIGRGRVATGERGGHGTAASAGGHPGDLHASASAGFFQVKNYFLDFAGDHSVNAATVIEQPTAGYVSYTVQLQLASGAEQSVVVAAPPGGLQIEMQDMTGDHVPNDVILRPALLHWPPTVLVNDGHDHYAVVVSGADPGSFSSRQDFGSLPRNSQTFAFLRSTGFKVIHYSSHKRTLIPQLQQSFVSPSAQTFAWEMMDRASSPDRAPPFVTTI